MINGSTGKLSTEEKYYLSSWLRRTATLFCESHVELLLFLFVCERTIPFGKVTEKIVYRHFNGMFNPKHFHTGCGLSRRSVINAKQSLNERGIIFFSEDNYFAVNIHGIVKALSVVFGIAMGDKEARCLKSAAEVFLDRFPDLKEVEAQMVPEKKKTIEDAMSENARKAQMQKEKESKKRKAKRTDEIAIKDVFPIMEEACKDNDLRFYDEMLVKTKGQIRNWLRYCSESGKHPRLLLQAVVRVWPVFRATQLFWPDGNPIILSEVPSFTEYFTHRQAVNRWLDINKDKPVEKGKWDDVEWEKEELPELPEREKQQLDAARRRNK